MRFLSTLVASTVGTLIALGLIFLFGFLFIIALVSSSDQAPSVRAGSVLVMELSGPVPELVAEDPFAEALGDVPTYDLVDVKASLEKAAADDRIEAVWLRTRNVVAPWATLQEIREALVDFRASGKPLLASSEDYSMTEADYFLASAAEAVYGAPQSFFEFNGFFILAEFYKGLFDMLNVQVETVRAGDFKSAVEPFIRTDLSPENEAQLSAILTTQSDVYLNAIAESRELDRTELNRLVELQAIINADDAFRAGLLDGLLYENDVEAEFKQRLELAEDDDLRTISFNAYRQVPASSAGIEVDADDEIAVVYGVGTIMSGESGESGNPLAGTVLGSETFNEALRDVRENDRVKAVVIRINSPGGSAAASEVMRHEIARTAAVKPVVISMGDVAASGGYWMSAGAETVVADPLTITGSIGVFSLFFNVGPFFDSKLGITHDQVSTSPFADMFSGFSDLSPAERDLMQRSTDQTYEQFLELVAEARDMTVQEVDAIASGRVWTGEDALDIGLVDELGGLERALELAAEQAGLEADNYRIRRVPRPLIHAPCRSAKAGRSNGATR